MGKKDEKVAYLENATYFKKYRASHVLVDLGLVYLVLRFGEFPRLVGRYCSYLPPKLGA